MEHGGFQSRKLLHRRLWWKSQLSTHAIQNIKSTPGQRLDKPWALVGDTVKPWLPSYNRNKSHQGKMPAAGTSGNSRLCCSFTNLKMV